MVSRYCRLAAVPHISQKKRFRTFSDSFSPRGEACVTDRTFFLLSSNVEISTKGFSLEGEAVKNRLFGTDF